MKRIYYFLTTGKYKDSWINFSLFALVLIGSLMIVSISVGETSFSSANIVISTFRKQIITVFLAYILLILAAKLFNFKLFDFFKKPLALFFLGFLIIPLFFTSFNGAKNWIPIGTAFTLQPSEFFKSFIILYNGVFYANLKKNNYRDLKAQLFKISSAPMVTIYAFLIVLFLQKDLGSAIIILAISFIAFFITDFPQFKDYYRRSLLAILVIIVLIIFFLSPIGFWLIEKLFGENSYKSARFLVVNNPFKYKEGFGLQLLYGLEAIASGGFWGRGYGNSLLKFRLPEGKTDYISTLIIEEGGLFLFLIISCLIFFIVFRLFKHAKKTDLIQEKIVLLSTGFYILIHYILNTGGVSGFIPLTGVPILFISLGGSSLFSSFIILGVCQKIINNIKQRKLEGGSG